VAIDKPDFADEDHDRRGAPLRGPGRHEMGESRVTVKIIGPRLVTACRAANGDAVNPTVKQVKT
jgi:hypothetical protein